MFSLRSILFMFFVIIGCQLAAQIKIKTYTTATDTFYWKKYEHVLPPAKASLKKFIVQNGDQTIRTFLAHPPSKFGEILSDSLRMHAKEPIRKYLFPVDLNNDLLPDIIFNGSGRNETGMVQIYLNRNDSFELVFEDFRYVTSLKKGQAGFSEIVTGDAGSREDYLYFERRYKLQSERHSLLFVRELQSVVYKYTQRPGKYFARSVPFNSLNDTILVRASASLIDAPYNPKLKSYGNIIGGYTGFISGNILASEKDVTGKTWYYAEIFPSEMPHKSIFYGIDNFPTLIIGWLDSEEVSAHFADGLKSR